MPTNVFLYVLEKIKRSIAGQKVLDKEDVDGALLYTAAETEDVDGNATGVVRLAGIDADGNATTQDLGTAALKTVGNAAGQLPVVEAGGKLPASVTGDITADQVPNLPASKIKSGVLKAAQVPNLPASKIKSGVLKAAQVPNLPASKITSGVLKAAQVPNLPASKITSGVLKADQVPNLPASKITSEVLKAAQVPNLPASKITSGVLKAAQVPNLPASKIKSEVLKAARLATGKKGVGKVIVGTAAGQEWQEMQTPNRNGVRLEALVNLARQRWVDVISIPITPRSNTKKIKVSIAAFFEYEKPRPGQYQEDVTQSIRCKVLRGNTVIIADFGNMTGAQYSYIGTEPVVAFTIDSPESAAEQTYKLQCNHNSLSNTQAGVGTAIEVEEL